MGGNLAKHITWSLMPLGLETPVDPIAYIRQESTPPKNNAVRQFLGALKASIETVRESGADTAQLLTTFNISLKSVKKIDRADVIVGVDGSGADANGPLLITKWKEVPRAGFPPGEVCKQVKEALKDKYPAGWKFTGSSHHARAWKFFKIRPSHWPPQEGEVDEQFCYFDPTFKQYAYTQAWIDLLIKEFSREKQFEQVMSAR